MIINQQLNSHLKRESAIFNQYLTLVNQQDLSIANGYQSEADEAQIEFLRFYLDSVTRIITNYADKSEAELFLNEQFCKAQALIVDSDPDAQKCIKKMEETSNYWSSLCH